MPNKDTNTKTMKKLNDRQREFARLLATGMKQADAYRKAFDCKGMKRGAVATNASRLAKNADLLQFLTELRKEADTPAVLERQRRMELLSQIAVENVQTKPREAIAAIAELNKMDGAYSPERVEVSGTLGVAHVVAALQECEQEPLVLPQP